MITRKQYRLTWGLVFYCGTMRNWLTRKVALMSEPNEPHQRLDRAMRERGIELGKRWVQIAREAGITTSALGGIRRGQYRPSPHTARALERALQWESGSVDAILAGGDPVPLRSTAEVIASTQEITAQVERRLAEQRSSPDRDELAARVARIMATETGRKRLAKLLDLIEEN